MNRWSNVVVTVLAVIALITMMMAPALFGLSWGKAFLGMAISFGVFCYADREMRILVVAGLLDLVSGQSLRRRYMLKLYNRFYRY